MGKDFMSLFFLSEVTQVPLNVTRSVCATWNRVNDTERLNKSMRLNDASAGDLVCFNPFIYMELNAFYYNYNTGCL